MCYIQFPNGTFVNLKQVQYITKSEYYSKSNGDKGISFVFGGDSVLNVNFDTKEDREVIYKKLTEVINKNNKTQLL